MAITQTNAQGRGMGQVHPSSADGFNYVQIGTIWFIVGSGAPTAGANSELKDAPKGSVYFSDAPKVYLKSSAGDGSTNTTWVDLTLDT